MTHFPRIATKLVAFGRSVILNSGLAALMLAVYANLFYFSGNISLFTSAISSLRADSSLLQRFIVVCREGGGVCASSLRLVSGSRMPDMMRVVRRSSTQREAVIKNADMTEDMQQDDVDCAKQATEKYNIEKDIAAYVKKEFDKKYNPTWHCIVGRNFGSYVTHETKHFIYFYLGQVAVLLFKSG